MANEMQETKTTWQVTPGSSWYVAGDGEGFFADSYKDAEAAAEILNRYASRHTSAALPAGEAVPEWATKGRAGEPVTLLQQLEQVMEFGSAMERLAIENEAARKEEASAANDAIMRVVSLEAAGEELRTLLDECVPWLEHSFQPTHEGSCSPETPCDMGCVDNAALSVLLGKVRRLSRPAHVEGA